MTRPAWRDFLERCGLHVLEDTAAHHGPPVLAAIRAVAGYEVRPAATIPLASPDATAELDRAWHLHATDTSLHDPGADPGPAGHGGAREFPDPPARLQSHRPRLGPRPRHEPRQPPLPHRRSHGLPGIHHRLARRAPAVRGFGGGVRLLGRAAHVRLRGACG
ncbi:hypothetical protein SGLAM104S_01460 [Streptomyces glaucescens]